MVYMQDMLKAYLLMYKLLTFLFEEGLYDNEEAARRVLDKLYVQDSKHSFENANFLNVREFIAGFKVPATQDNLDEDIYEYVCNFVANHANTFSRAFSSAITYEVWSKYYEATTYEKLFSELHRTNKLNATNWHIGQFVAVAVMIVIYFFLLKL